MKSKGRSNTSRIWIHGVAKKGCASTAENINGKSVTKRSYVTWTGMLNRCYDQKFQEQHPSYKGCTVCNDWLFYSNFEIWYNNNIPDKINRWELDKDILVQGNKEYSPNTCCFVPQKINSLLINPSASRGKYPIGVTFSKSLAASEQRILVQGRNITRKGFLQQEKLLTFIKSLNISL